jgi:phage shock protein A
MSIFDRAKSVIASNVGAVVSSFREGESPQKQHQAALLAAVAAEKSLRAQCERLGAEVERWVKRAQLAIAAGDDGLAREALKKKQRLENELADASRALGEASLVVERTRAEMSNPQAIAVVNTGTDADSVIARMEAKVSQLEAVMPTPSGPQNEASGAGYSHLPPEPEPPSPSVRYRVK